MSEQEEKNRPFVINDRRKFRMDGEPRAEAPQEPVQEAADITEATPAKPGPVAVPDAPAEPIAFNAAHSITPVPEPDENAAEAQSSTGEPPMPPPPTAEETEQVRAAYLATAERLDTMMRSQNLGGEHLPPMDFTQLVQSVYMSAMMQLGAGTQQGQQPRVDLLGAKQSIDMLGLIEEKTAGNVEESETRLLSSALFELRMGFLEITQLLARQAQAKQTTQPAPGTGGGGFGGGGFTGGGPRLVP